MRINKSLLLTKEGQWQVESIFSYAEVNEAENCKLILVHSFDFQVGKLVFVKVNYVTYKTERNFDSFKSLVYDFKVANVEFNTLFINQL